MPRIAGWLAVLTLTMVQALPAQAQRGRGPADAYEVRMELASVLLQSKRYHEAAREYRGILAQRPNNFSARLGLARALAWSRQHREAEAELRLLRSQQPRNSDVQGLLRSVRQSLEPAAAEAAAWLGEDPGYPPYRRALARAFMREGDPRSAAQHYERLLSLDLSTPLVVEAAQAYLEARQHDRAAVLLDRAVARHPSDARLLLARAQVSYARRDLRAAEADALASLRITPTPDAYLLLGDVRRWRADYADARTVYEYARRLDPTSARVRVAHAQLARAQRPVPAFVPAASFGNGWHLRTAAVSDNAGVAYTTAGARREVDIGTGTTASIDVEMRHMQEQSPLVDDEITGAAFTAGLAHEIAQGTWLVQLQGRGGAVHHFADPMFTGGASIAVWNGAWATSLEYVHRPAYGTLLTAATVEDEEDTPLHESTFTGATGGPLGAADFALSAQRSVFSDDNQRITAQLLLRAPASRHVAVLVAVGGVWYAETSDLYWSPDAYVAGSAGLEVAARRPLGFSVAVRALAGPSRNVEDTVQTSLQYSAGVDFNYRSLSRDVGMALSYGTGRGGGYSRFEVGAYANLLR